MSDEDRGMGHHAMRRPLVEEAAKAERNRLWREENRVALEAYEREVPCEGLALAAFRSF